jgi:L-lysine exporter family protein LysE/ArgO
MYLFPVLYGFLLGFALCFTFGPAFFALIQTSIDNGSRSAYLIAGGVVIADVLLMATAVFGTEYIPKIPHFDDYLSISGASILLIMGILSFRKERKQLIYPKTPLGDFAFYFSKGFFLNLLNPSNYAFVFATTLSLRNSLHYNQSQIIVFFASSLLGASVAEVLIAYYAQKLKRFLTDLLIYRINQIAGVVFIVASIRILIGYFS